MRTLADQLDDIAHAIDDKAREYAKLEALAVEAKRDYEVAFNRALLAADHKATVDDKKAQAQLSAGDERYSKDLADAQVRGCREALRALHARLDAARSLLAKEREEAKLAGQGGTP